MDKKLNARFKFDYERHPIRIEPIDKICNDINLIILDIKRQQIIDRFLNRQEEK